MDNLNITSGQNYAQVLINSILELQAELSEEEKEDPQLLEYVFEEITSLADKTWTRYVVGNRESYKFSTEEMSDLYRKAYERLIDHMLEKLSDKGFVQTSINKDGDIVYGLTEKGKQVVNKKK